MSASVELGIYRDQIGDGLSELYATLPDTHRDRREASKDEAIDRELRFIGMVSTTVGELADGNTDPLNLLYDVDETLVKLQFVSEQVTNTIMRPGLPILSDILAEHYGDRLSYGILSSRGQRILDEELITPTYTSSFSDRIDPRLVISSRNGKLVRENPSWEYGNVFGEEQNAVNILRAIIDPRIADAALTDDYKTLETLVGRGHWFDPKLAILATLAAENPDQRFALIDDLPFPATVDPNHSQVRAVSLVGASFRI